MPVTKMHDHFIADRCIHANFTPKTYTYIPPPKTDIKWLLNYALFLQVIDEKGNDFDEEW